MFPWEGGGQMARLVTDSEMTLSPAAPGARSQQAPHCCPGTGAHKDLDLWSHRTQLRNKRDDPRMRQFQGETGGWEREGLGNTASEGSQTRQGAHVPPAKLGGKRQTHSLRDSTEGKCKGPEAHAVLATFEVNTAKAGSLGRGRLACCGP